MAGESRVAAHFYLIGKTQMLAGLTEVKAAVAAVNKEMLASADAAKTQAVANDAFYATGGKSLAAYRAEQVAATEAQAASMVTLGKRAVFSLGAVAAVVGYESVKFYTNFQQQVTRLNTQAGMTVRGMNLIADAARKLGPSLGATPESFVQAAYHPASAGFSPADAIAITVNAQKQAMMSGANLEDTTNSLTAAMKAYNLHAAQAAKTQAMLNAIVGSGNMHFQDLNGAMSTGLLSSSQTFGIGIQSVGAALAFMTDRGVPAQQAGTRLRMSEALLGAPTKASSKILTAIGLSNGEVTARTSAMSEALTKAGLTTTKLAADLRKPNGLLAALSDLHQHLTSGGLSPEGQAALITRAFGGGRSGSAIVMMYQNLPSLAQKYSQVGRMATTGTFNSDYAKAMQNQASALKVLDANWHAFGITVGATFGPSLTHATKGAADLLGVLSRSKAAMMGLAGVVTLVLGPAIGVYLKSKFLESGGALRTVIRGYANLVRAIYRLIPGLGAQDTAEAVAIGENDALAASATAAGGAESRLGLGALASRTALGATIAWMGFDALGNHANSVFANQKVPMLSSRLAIEAKIASLKNQIHADSQGVLSHAASWGPFGGFGKWLTAEHVPFMQNNSAGVVARDQAQLGQYEKELAHMTPRVNIYIDGKKVFAAVQNQARQQVARN